MPLDRWELLLIDNGSSSPLSLSYDLSWHPNARHVREDKLGLTMARLRGIHEATSDLLVFVDDDNVLDARYLETALQLSVEWPKVGVFGGSQIPDYEESSDGLEDCLHMLAIRTIAEVLWTNIKGIDQATPRGAGLCIRRDLALNYARRVEVDPLRKMLDRSGKSGLLSGGDTDLAWTACDFNYGMLVSPALRLTHLIDKRRLDKSYLLKLAAGHAASGVLLAHIHNMPRSNSLLIDNSREILRILQASRLFEKRVLISGMMGRRRGYKILQEYTDASISCSVEREKKNEAK